MITVENIKDVFSSNTKLLSFITDDLECNLSREKQEKQQFECAIQNLETHLIVLHNGFFVEQQHVFDPVLICGFHEAKTKYPELYASYFNKIDERFQNETVRFNTEHAPDGVFIYIPDNTTVSKPIQIVNYTGFNHPLFKQTRFLIIAGKNSHFSLIQCNDSVNHQKSISHSICEIHLQENASLNYIKMQNLNDQSALINTNFITQQKDSKLTSISFNLNGGLIQTEEYCMLSGENAEVDVTGLYVTDEKQHIVNQVNIIHQEKNCRSNQLFKGIMDDASTAVFNGHVKVLQGAQKTEAFQSNKNILLSDKAKITTRPFLEIYADDVKCSHGATIGQLDENAMFYMRARGISYPNARMLLLYAFADEIINRVNITPLHVYIEDSVKKRLRGELSSCEYCVLVCNHPEKGEQNC